MKKKIFVVLLCLFALFGVNLSAISLENLTREEAAVFAVDFLGLEDESILYYSDLGEITEKKAVSRAVRAGLFENSDAFRPNDILSSDEIEYAMAKLNRSHVIKGNSEYASSLVLDDVLFGGNVVLNEYVKDASITNSTILGNLYADGSVNLNFSGIARVIEVKESSAVTIGKNSSIEYLYIWGDDSSLVVDGSVGTIVIYGKNVSIKGSGDVALLRANGDNLVSEIGASRITVGDIVSPDALPLIENEVFDPSKSGPAISPDKDKIIKAAKEMPQYVELLYDVDYHFGPIDESHPFSSIYCTGGHVSAEAYGYVEKEYLMKGKANVYNLYENDTPYIVRESVDYATRVLVRYPDPEKRKASGNVVVEILNASSAVDLEDLWRRAWDLFMERGDVYIGITSQSGAAEALKIFDSERYKDIKWDGEDGLFFDMLSQLANTIRDEQSLLIPSAIDVDNIILVGQSWSGDYINTYVSVFYDYYNAERSLFDGYLAIVNPGETFIASGVAGPVRTFRRTKEPYISLMSQAEHYFGSYGSWYLDFEYIRVPDATGDDYNVRFYEVAGAGHSDPVSPIIPSSAEIAKAGGSRPDKVYNGDQKPSDLQMDMVIRGAYLNLIKWIEDGEPAPSADDKWLIYRTVVDPFVGDMPECVLDENGNALGGIRMPQIEAPVASYSPFRNGQSTTDGSMIYFSKAKLSELYPAGYSEYMSKFGKAASALVNEGYISTADYAILMRGESNMDLFF